MAINGLLDDIHSDRHLMTTNNRFERVFNHKLGCDASVAPLKEYLHIILVQLIVASTLET